MLTENLREDCLSSQNRESTGLFVPFCLCASNGGPVGTAWGYPDGYYMHKLGNHQSRFVDWKLTFTTFEPRSPWSITTCFERKLPLNIFVNSLSEVKSRAIITVLQFAWHRLLHPSGCAFGAPPPPDYLVHFLECCGTTMLKLCRSNQLWSSFPPTCQNEITPHTCVPFVLFYFCCCPGYL